jgi:hypothetical protein
MDFFQSRQTVPKPLLSYLLPYSRTFNCTSKTTGWFTRAVIPTCPTLTKCYSKVAHAYTLMDFFQSHKLCPNRCYLTFFHIPGSIALVKRLAGCKRSWTCPTLTKCYSRCTRILTLMDFFRAKLCLKPLLSSFFHIPERSIALVKRLAGSPKLKWNLNLTQVLLKVAHAFLYTLMDFFQSHQTVKPLLSYLLPYSTFNCTSKTTGWFTKGLKLIRPAPR